MTRRPLFARRVGIAALLAVVGPGLLAGLSDDDPAGITTYSTLGATYGYQLLWVLLLATGALILFHDLGSRIGVITGQGLIGIIRERYGVRIASMAISVLLVANIGTTAAEFAGIAAGFELFGITRYVSVPVAAALVSFLVLKGSFHRVEHVLLLLGAVFISYIVAGFLAHPDWAAAGRGLVLPSVPFERTAVLLVTATIGTTLAPWGLSFVQSYAVDKKLRLQDLRYERADVVTGAVLTGVIGAFVVIACAATLHVQGITIESELDRCLFCAGPITSERRDQLARHFDESWLRIRGEARDLLAAVVAEKEALASWVSALPRPESLVSDLQSAYEEAVEGARAEIAERTVTLEAVEASLNAKVLDPSATPEAPDWALLSLSLSTAVLVQAVTEHNDQARRHEEVAAERKQIVLDHLVGSQSEAFRQLEEQAKGFKDRSATSRAAAALAERRLDEVRQAQFTTKDMADTLTSDLARVYGKDHLSVAVTGDGKSYACRRGDRPGTDLSDGERTTLSLLYFLRKLEDEQVSGGEPSQRMVVIDDPSSSLDREALFATHQWLVDTLKGFGQYIVLTHDFSLLRLFIKSHRNAWGSSMKRISQEDAAEIRFPKVAFLEMYATAVDGERRSRMGKLPRLLLNSTSEYGYLFSMVMAGVAESEDHERLFLLPNAARRVLEVFASYKAPHRPDFLQQLEVLVQVQADEPYRDVYDFCNRFSHGEGSESIDVLDARAVHGQIRRSMEFLRAVDEEHFQRMCQATDIDPATLS